MSRNYAGLLGLMLSLVVAPALHAESLPTDQTFALGRALYHGQASISGAVRVGNVTLPASSGACANCHGSSGQGSREGGVTVPGIAWAYLSQPQRGQPGYRSPRAVLDAIEKGQGRGGEPLNPPMPTIELSTAEADALIAYLQIIGTEREPVQGVSNDRILVGSILPLTPPGSYAERIRAGLEERFGAINRDGGIFGRRIELVIEDSGRQGRNASQALERLAKQHRVFALVGSVLPEPSATVVGTIRQHGLPVVATLGVPIQDSPDDKLTYLLPSVVDQIKQLLAEVKTRCKAGKDIVVLHESRQGLADGVQTALANESFIVSVQESRIDHLPGMGTLWGRSPAPNWVVLGSSDFVGQVRGRAISTSTDSIPCLATLAMLSGMPALERHGQSRGGSATRPMEVIGLPMPATAVLLEQKFQGDALWTYLADVSARIFAESLSRSSRILNYDSFDRSLQSLHGFEPHDGLPIRFSRQHRHGLSVAHMWGRTQHAYKKQNY